MNQSTSPSSPVDASFFKYVVGIDIGSQTCSVCALKPDKSQVIKPTEFANAMPGFLVVLTKLEALGVPPAQILIGLEATSRYGENLYHFLESRGYQLCLLHPRQTHAFAQRRGLRAKTDTLDATTIARLLLSGDARLGYMPTDLIATYRELVRLHSQLADEAARYKNEIQALLAVLFPEFSQVFADPCRSTAVALLKLYPRAQAVAKAGVETIAAKLHELAPRNYGRTTAEQLVSLAQHSVSSGVATSARSISLKIRMSTSLSIPRRTWHLWKGRSTHSWRRTKGQKDSKVCLNLDTRPWRSCERNWGMCIASSVQIRWSPMPGWIWK